MREPTAMVFYLPASASAPVLDSATALDRLGAEDRRRWGSERWAATWAGLEILVLVQRQGELDRLVVEFRSADWIEMTRVTPSGGFARPGPLRRLVESFATAADELGAVLALKTRHTLADGCWSWAGLIEGIDVALGATSAAELLRGPVDLVFVADDHQPVLEWHPDPALGWMTGFLGGFRTARGTVCFADGVPVVRPLPWWPRDAVFNAAAAHDWPHRWWGLWVHVHFVRTGEALGRDAPEDYRDNSVPADIRHFLADYLEAAPPALALAEPSLLPTVCLLCGDPVRSHAMVSDGEWWWPIELGHHIRHHDFVLPNELAAAIFAAGGVPPAHIDRPVEELPWPPRFDDEAPWPIPLGPVETLGPPPDRPRPRSRFRRRRARKRP